MKKNLLFLTISSLMVSSVAVYAFAANFTEKTKSITIYGNSPQTWENNWYYNYDANSQGFAIINNILDVELNQGKNEVFIKDLPDEISPASIVLKNLDKKTELMEQQVGLKTSLNSLLLEQNIGKEIEVTANEGSKTQIYKGVLIETTPNIVIKEEDKVRVINSYSNLVLSEINTRPSKNYIKWLLFSKEGDQVSAEYSYKTAGINWSAMYNVFINDDENDDEVKLKIESWANILNSTKINIEDATLKLIAGNVNQAEDVSSPPPPPMPMLAMVADMPSSEMRAKGSFAMREENFSDYHAYAIDRKISITANSYKKIKLSDDKNNITASKKYTLDSNLGDRVNIVLNIENSKDNGLGVPFPGGKYIVYAKDKSGDFENIGEAKNNHKKDKDVISLNVGSAFDITAKRNRYDVRSDYEKRHGSYSVVIEIENLKEKEVLVTAKEHIGEQNWKIINENIPYVKIDENTVEFPVKVPAKYKGKIQYSVEHSW
jgi:hypothetical protein